MTWYALQHKPSQGDRALTHLQKAGTSVSRLPVREHGANGSNVGQAALNAWHPPGCQLCQ